MPLLDSWDNAKERCAALRRMWESTKEVVRRNPGLEAANWLDLDIPGARRGKPTKRLKRFFDRMDEQIDEARFIILAATFERIVFLRIGDSSQRMNKALAKAYPSADPFGGFTSGFVKTVDEVFNLGGIERVLSPGLSPEYKDKFHQVVEYRNYLLHGKRFAPVREPVTPEETEAILEYILEETAIRKT